LERSIDVYSIRSTIAVKLASCSLAAAAVVAISGMMLPVADAPTPSAAASAADLAAAAEEIVKGLEPTVASATSFKQDQEGVEHNAYVLALIANSIPDAEGDAKWKASALAVRDAALELAKAKAQTAAAKAVKDIKSLTEGAGKAAGAGKAMKPLEVCSLTHVMKEVNNRNRPMRKNLRALARNQDTVRRDAQVWAVLAAAARNDTKSAQTAKKSQEPFEKLSDEFFTHSKSLADAAKKGDQNAANEALKAVSAACANCHKDYRPDLE
jgi:cytochrome c556